MRGKGPEMALLSVFTLGLFWSCMQDVGWGCSHLKLVLELKNQFQTHSESCWQKVSAPCYVNISIRLYIIWQLASLRHMIKEQWRVTPHCLLWSRFWVTSAVSVINESLSEAYSQQEEITHNMNNRRQGSLGPILKAGYFNCNENFQFIWGNWLILMLIC